MACPLCERKEITRKYYEDNLVWIDDCRTCGTPMVVWKEHVREISENDINYAINKLKTALKEDFQNYWLDFNRRAIPYHFHFFFSNFSIFLSNGTLIVIEGIYLYYNISYSPTIGIFNKI